MKWSFRADDRTRTDDLIPTKDVLYQLSYVSNRSTKVMFSSEFKTFVEIILSNYFKQFILHFIR